jgi:hypothetical protein
MLRGPKSTTTKSKPVLTGKHHRNQRGYTLLEYAAGATVLLALLYAGLNTMGTGIKDLMGGIGTWAAAQSASLPNNPSNPN